MSNPLDKTQALLYGKFVLAVYAMFGSDPNNLRPQPQGIPEGYELGAWIHMCDFVLNLEEPKFYGIVAHKIGDVHSRVIAIRGTEGLVEWLDDAFCILVPFHQVPSAGRVACGFDKIYKTLKVVRYTPPKAAATLAAAPETFTGSFAEQLDQLAAIREAAVVGAAKTAARAPRPTVVAGHSLGAALSTLFVMENDSKRKFDITTSCTFASPRVGNMEFARTFNQLPIDSWRIVNTPDLVPKLPPHIPIVLDYDHVDVACAFPSDNNTKHNLLCYHAMETYLHWLDGTFPLRPDCQP